jgi:predicted  nucleic acid-binding Zn-ribbon protein
MSSLLTTSQFIERAINIHGKKYSYKNTNYLNSHSIVEIECQVHGIFYQIANGHLNGRGCPKCKWDKIHSLIRDTRYSFIKKAEEIHNDTYDYSSLIYKNNKTRVNIICKIHGVFLQLPFNHLMGNGCPKCGYEKCNNIKFSKLEKEFLDYHGIENRNVVIGNYVVDGLKDNVIYEFLGDYWHGNPSKFNPLDINPSKNKTFGKLFGETFLRFDALKNMGYSIKYVWEKDWKLFEQKSLIVKSY